MLLILPGACADNIIYPAPQEIPAGGAIEHLVAAVDPGSAVTASLPDGLSLLLDEQEERTDIYLLGTLYTPGVYDCIINVNNSSFTCPVTVAPETPTVVACPDLHCYPGEAVLVSISASITGSGQLSYQWYQSLSASDPGQPIEGALENELVVSAQQLGTTYYSCLVTNSFGGYTRTAYSRPIAVTVEELSVSALYIGNLPRRTSYYVGESLDTSGLRLCAELSNGEVQILTEGFGVYPIRLDTPGSQRIEISYQGQSCEFTVDVQEGGELITGIGVLTLPAKTHYLVGESLDSKGLSIRAYTNEGYRDVSEGLDCSPSRFEQAGDAVVTVSYGGKLCTFTVQVSAEARPVSLSVARLPAKIQYAVGETLDTTGLVLRQVDSNNESTEINADFTCTPTVFERVGHQEITVYYGELSCRFNVTVTQSAPVPAPAPSASVTPGVTPTPSVSAPPSATPAPSPSVTPGAPSALPSLSPAPHVTAAPVVVQRGGNARTLFIAVIILSLLSLAVLGGYVFVMNRGGPEQARAAIEDFLRRFRRR